MPFIVVQPSEVHSNEEKESVFSSTENILDRLLGVYFLRSHDCLVHSEKIWMQLISFGHQGKYGERETSMYTGLCVLTSVGRMRFLVPLLYVKYIFKCDLNLKAMLNTNQNLLRYHFNLFWRCYWALLTVIKMILQVTGSLES